MLKIGKIHLIIGPMFSGKTTELIKIINKYENSNLKCLLIKYKKDNRYFENYICTHEKVCKKAVPLIYLFDIYNKNYDVENYDVICIDEGQFFKDLIPFSENAANVLNKIVVISALDGNFRRESFDNVVNLIPKSEIVKKLSARCMDCFKKASFTHRIVANNEIELIGDKNSYKSVCRNCFMKNNLK